MLSILKKDFLSWEKKQLLKGGDKQSLHLLLEAKAGITSENINLARLNPSGNLFLKENLDAVESIWDNHLKNGVPIQYLCGFAYWRNLKLKVSEQVLIPRSETELIVDVIQNKFLSKEKLVFADLGTGSGAIGISLALANPKWEGYATDIDKNALDIASKNFFNFSDKSNLKFLNGHWWNPLKDLKGKLDLVISNPPYIPLETYQELPNEVKNFEPKIALLGGVDGLDNIREIIQKAPFYLKEKGWLILENHFDQGSKLIQLFLQNMFTSVEVVKDYSGIGRFTIGRYK